MSTFPTPQPITAKLTTGGARVRITASERSDTTVRVDPIDSTNRTDVRTAEKTKVAFAAGELTVETVKAGPVLITVELPTGSRLALSSASSDVHAAGPLGECTVDLASGQVELDRITALRGNLASGTVTVGHVAGTVDLQGGTADVRLGEVEGTVRYQGSTGKVAIGHARSDVEFSGSGGRFDLDRADGSVVAKAADCPIRIGRLAGAHAELVNAAGGIEVGVAAGLAAEVDAESTKGSVRNSLPSQTGATVKIHARTRRDDIVIRQS